MKYKAQNIIEIVSSEWITAVLDWSCDNVWKHAFLFIFEIIDIWLTSLDSFKAFFNLWLEED